ncbi:hypothetical protein ACROYT_G037114 [Oculina patagonica]
MSFTTILLALLGIGYALGDGNCDGIDPQKRVDCGYFGIQRDECVTTRHCCYDDTVPGVPWCFRPKVELVDKCRSIHPLKRDDCGWIGITKDACEGRGCCYDDSYNHLGVKSCFYPTDSKCYGIVPEKRKECGYFGIQRDECEKDRGCCFDHTVPDARWCFVGRRPPAPVPTQGPTEGSGVGPTTEEPTEELTTEPTTTEKPTTPSMEA